MTARRKTAGRPPKVDPLEAELARAEELIHEAGRILSSGAIEQNDDQFNRAIAECAFELLAKGSAIGNDPFELSPDDRAFVEEGLLVLVKQLVNPVKAHVMQDYLTEVMSTTAALALDEYLKRCAPGYDRYTKAMTFGVARALVEDLTSQRLVTHLDARGGSSSRAQADDLAPFRAEFESLSKVWRRVCSLKENYDRWSLMTGLRDIKSLPPKSRSNAAALLRQLDDGLRTARPSYLAARHAALNFDRDDLLKLKDRTLLDRLSATVSRPTK